MLRSTISFILLFVIPLAFCQQRKLLIIGIDGCRSDVITHQFAPAIDSIIHLPNTAYSYKMKIESRTLSAPNWSSMLTGVHCSRHKAKSNTFIKNKLDRYPHIFRHLEFRDTSIQTASFPHWMPINKFIVRGYADFAPVLKKEPSDQEVFSKAESWLQAKTSPDAIFIHFDDVDHNGHSSGFSPSNKKYTDAVTQVDRYVRELFSYISDRKEKYKENWLVIISTDHGGRKRSHANGFFNEAIRRVFVVINGEDAQPGEIEDAKTVDIAYTALSFFKVSIKAEWKLQGKAIGLKK